MIRYSSYNTGFHRQIVFAYSAIYFILKREMIFYYKTTQVRSNVNTFKQNGSYITIMK